LTDSYFNYDPEQIIGSISQQEFFLVNQNVTARFPLHTKNRTKLERLDIVSTIIKIHLHP